jgi:hypothetical protein
MSTYKRVGFDKEREDILAEREVQIEPVLEDSLELNTEALDKIEKEMEKISQGLSNLTKSGIQDSGLIVKNYFTSTLKQNFCKKSVATFLELTAQDYGRKAARQFKEWLDA